MAFHNLPRHASQPPSTYVVAIQNQLVVAPPLALTARETMTPSNRLLVRFAARAAVDSAVAHTALGEESLDVALAIDVLNLLMSADRVRD